MFDSLEHFLRPLRVADGCDIALVSLFLYGALSWFKRTASRSVLVGISLLAVVYFAARAFDMYLTALLFQGAFAVLLVALVVVFQEDLRRLFERVATLGTLQERFRPAGGLTHLDTLLEMASDLASRRIGALLVIKGHEPLERHIEGGVEVDGQISRALLDSIFDPHSMGHDGAVIIENDRLRRFAVHLPLSHNLRELGQRGTRHGAALGLSELSDALVIVVSEERGQISVARRGKLTPMGSLTELQQVLDQFNREMFPRQAKSMVSRLLREDAALKVVSVLLACLAWFSVYRAGKVQQTFNVPIEYRNAPEGLVMEDATPLQARVTFSGYEHAFGLLAANTLKISLDLTGLGDGVHRVAIEDDNVKRPPNLVVYQIEPRSVSLEVHSLVSVELPIEVRTIGQPPAGMELVRTSCVPATVKVKVWKTRSSTTTRLFTDPIDVRAMSKTTTVKAGLAIPSDIRLASNAPPDVRVTLEISAAAARP